MPPKPKCSREDIICAAYDILQESGIDSVVAREVGKRLGTTTGPIFTFFDSMDELREAVYQKAYKDCSDYLYESLEMEEAFKEFGHRWLKYAYEKPNNYSMIFVNKRSDTDAVGFLNPDFDDFLLRMRQVVSKKYDLSDEDAKGLINNICVYAQGLASFLVAGRGYYDENEINKSLARICLSYVAGCKVLDGSMDVDSFKKKMSSIN